MPQTRLSEQTMENDAGQTTASSMDSDVLHESQDGPPVGKLSPHGSGALTALLDDFDRGGERALRQSRIDRVLERKGVSNEDILLILAALASRGVEIFDDVGQDSTGDDQSAADKHAKSPPDGFARFMQCIRREGLLSAREEVALGRAVALASRCAPDGSSSANALIKRGAIARTRMISSNVRLVLSIARRYIGVCDMDLEDLVQEGIVGLMRAVERYDHTLGYKFSTYATYWIMQSITRAMSDRGYVIRIPVHLVEELWRVRRARRFLTREGMGRTATARQIADELDLDLARVHFLLNLERLSPVSLDEPDESGDATPLDFLESPWPTPEEEACNSERAVRLLAALATLGERAQEVLKLRFGLEDGDEWTLERIGQRYGLTRERIRQIESKALNKLHKRIESLGLSSYREAPSKDEEVQAPNAN